jgi:hypothetical protein
VYSGGKTGRVRRAASCVAYRILKVFWGLVCEKWEGGGGAKRERGCGLWFGGVEGQLELLDRPPESELR